MEEPDKQNCNHASNLEDTVRNLREENAKLLQLLRSQGLLVDSSLNLNEKSSESIPSTVPESTNITFDQSELTLTTNTITTTNQINHQHIHNHGPMNQQSYNEQTIHGNQSNITPNFNTVIQSTTQPFVQNNSNTLVQNNTNLIQPINLVNFNNVSLDSIQSFFASQNNVMYLSQTSTSSPTTSILTNSPPNESLPSEQHSISIRSKPLANRFHQELVPVIPKMKAEYCENLTKQYENSSNTDTTNLLDNDSNQKLPRSIRPRPSSRANSSRIYTSGTANQKKYSSNILKPKSSFVNNSSPVSLFSSLEYSSSLSTTNYQSQSSSIENQIDLSQQLTHSKSLDLSSNKKSTKTRQRTRKKPSSSTITISRSLLTVSSSDNPISKRTTTTTNRKPTKRKLKTLDHSQSESILSTNVLSPSNAFAESISGLLENLDQELMASNFLSQATTSNLLTDETITPVQHLVNGAIEHHGETYQTTTISMPTLDEFNDRLEHETHDFNVENEQITSFMSEEDMRLVEMNFDENTFLKQFDLEDAGIRLSVNSDQNLFANILTDNSNSTNDQSIIQTNSSVSQSTNAVYPGSSLINNNVFTTVVPLGSQQRILQTNTHLNSNNNVTSLLPEEGIQLTARHIQPSQVATYESVNYQDILDDLVMVTDQDVLRHAQAATADDPSVVSTDFSFALLETTNDIISSTNIQLTTEQATTVLNELQYLYPIEQQQSIQKQTEILPDQQQSIVILDKLQSDIITSTTLNKNLHDNSIITDLSSLIQPESTHSPIVVPDTSTTAPTELVTPVRPSESTANISDTPALTSSSSTSLQPVQNEMIIDSGRLDHFTSDNSTVNNSDDVIEDLLRDTTPPTSNSYEIIERQGKTPIKNYVIIDNVDRLLEQIEPKRIDSNLFEQTFSRYQQKYHSNLQHQQNLEIKQSEESTRSISPVKVKLQEVYKQQSPSPEPLERPSLKITIRAKIPSVVSSDGKTQHKKIHKKKKKRSHKHHQKKKIVINPPPSPPPPSETECTGLTRFEQPLAELYHQPSPPTSDENQPKNETNALSPEQSESQSLPQPPPLSLLSTTTTTTTETTTTLHSGFIIDEQTPPSSITSLEHKQSPPPLLYNNQDTNDKLKANYSHIFNYDNNHEHDHHHHHQNNNTFITPPPEIDLNPQSNKTSPFENFCQFSNSTSKKKHHHHHHRKSSATSSTSSKSLTNTDYALDTDALEPVSPTPLETSKQKHTSSSSITTTTTTNYNDISPSYIEHNHHHQQKQMKDYHSKKPSSSSLTRSSRTIPSSSQMHQQSRSLSNHNYRIPQEPSLLPSILPPSYPSMHLDPYAQSYHHFAPRTAPVPPPFFNISFPNPFLNSHSTTATSSSSHFHHHHHSMKYPQHHHQQQHHYSHNSHHSHNYNNHSHHSSHDYSTHQPQYPYNSHLQRQQQYNNSNYMSSRDHHSFNR